MGREEERSGPPPGESRILDEAARVEIERLPNVLEAYPDIRFMTELRYEDKPHLTMVSASARCPPNPTTRSNGMQGQILFVRHRARS